MKKLLFIIAFLFVSLNLQAQKNVMKVYLEDGSSKQYKLEDISIMDFKKSNLSYTMEIYIFGSSISIDVRDIDSMGIATNGILYVMYLGGEGFHDIATIDSITFIPNSCIDISIGDQTWMCKNLDVDHYRNGDTIPQVTDPTKWGINKAGEWCYYNYDSENGKVYGKLYNYYAVTDPRGLAPVGWHVPTEKEWSVLKDYLGGELVAGGKMKESGISHWFSPNTDATNESGFSALPAGICFYEGTFSNLGYKTNWWCSDENDLQLGGTSEVDYNNSNFIAGGIGKTSGLSVRCLKGELVIPLINSIVPNAQFIGKEITITGTGFGKERGNSTVSFNYKTPLQSDYKSWSDTEIKVLVPAVAQFGTGVLSIKANGRISNEVDFTVKPNNIGNCDPIAIGTQTWMCKNLDVDHYRNGDSIPQVTDSSKWKNLKTGAWCYYNNNSANGEIYGKLYNWYAVNDPRGLAPIGWRVPSDRDWKNLEQFLGMSKSQADSIGYRGSNEGGKLKESGTELWRSPNEGATNESGFKALPGSYRGNQGAFYSLGKEADWWCSTTNTDEQAKFRNLSYYYSGIYRHNNNKEFGFSVRCLKGEPIVPEILWLIPNNGYVGEVVTIGGTNFGAVQGNSFVSFNSTKALQSDYISWSATQIKVMVPIGGTTGNITVTVDDTQSKGKRFIVKITCTERSSYSTVKIGRFEWMGENLDVCNYRNGDPIPEITDSLIWKNAKTGAWCYQNNNPANGKIYGKLYNWYAVNDPRGLAPEGWHVASNPEWTYMADFMGGKDVVGGKLKEVGTTNWNSPNGGATDEWRFKALPAAARGYSSFDNSMRFDKFGLYTFWWTSTGDYTSYIYYLEPEIFKGPYYRNDGFSVRCVKNYNPDTVSCTGRSTNTPITIGTQVWMGENLDVCTYRNGDPIPQVKDTTEWKNLKTGAWCYYDNDPINGIIYGKLYNWYAVNDPRGLAPTGWKVPSDKDWNELSDYAGGDTLMGVKLREIGTYHWGNYIGTRASDIWGFTALPCGCRENSGIYLDLDLRNYLWSSTENGLENAWCRIIYFTTTTNRIANIKENGYSVRCIKVKPMISVINKVTPDKGLVGDEITITGSNFGSTQGTSFVTFNGIKPQQSDYQSWSDTQIKLKVPNGAETGYIYVIEDGTKGNNVEFTVKPLNPEYCEYVTIGTQKWMCKNLDVSTYRNGDTIPEVTDPDVWADLKTGAWCYYKNDFANGVKYGKIYNGYALTDKRGLAPNGWHVPNNDEWGVLSDYLGGESVAGGKLKKTGFSDGFWQIPNQGATNETKFTALPGGYRGNFAAFYYLGYFGYWWGSTTFEFITCWGVDFSNTNLKETGFNKNVGCAIRCLKD